MYKYNLGLKKSGGGKRGGGGGGSSGGGGGGGSSGGSGSGGGCKWLWLLFIVVDILFYCSGYISLLWCLYYFIVLKAKIAPLLQHILGKIDKVTFGGGKKLNF